ncbi:MAG TPA: potassium-transporting ATPase subunit C [Solirubrobacteraceae bacterium]|jgi:K+-transporting ATPase ATPase C chain|nr:potassium-transporting ATPase subunit C [Solirubrobacteraceae bacterium]
MSIRKEFVSSVLGVLTLIVVCGLLYPLVITGVGQVAFPGNANGQQVRVHGKLVGSKIIGQSFASPVYKNGKVELSKGLPVTAPDPLYFQTRPSGTAPADNDAATSFANYGPNSTVTEQAIASNIAAYVALNGKYYPGGLTAARVPVDAADTSASGVDPDISAANARIQAYRIAAVRHLPLAEVDALIASYTAGRGLGFSGEPAVDVLELNLALDRL